MGCIQYEVSPQPLRMQVVPVGKMVPCAGNGSADTLLLKIMGGEKYSSAKSFLCVVEEKPECTRTLETCGKSL